MSLAPGPSPSVGRGELTLQPGFFTSSLFVDPFREDVELLVSAFYAALNPSPTSPNATSSRNQSHLHPFTLFKRVWDDQGWKWLHCKVFDARTRHTFVAVVLRLFLEKTSENEPIRTRVAALFALYMFHSTQPDSSFPPMRKWDYFSIPVDTYRALLRLPATLTDNTDLAILAPYCSQIVLTLGSRFHILPQSDLGPYVPRTLPREVFVANDAADPEVEEGQELPKKKGRPSRKETLRRTRAAVTNLGKWLDNTGVSGSSDDAHTMLESAPRALRAAYLKDKEALLDGLGDEEGRNTLISANHAMLARLKVIDERAAARGMEVGSEGGERTGMGRAERAVRELMRSEQQRRGGLLGLMEGAGLDIDQE